jgi:glucose-1-phosphate adenylyltransferase
MHEVLSLILGGGRGARLYPLTRRRSEPAVPLAGKYRLIDVPVSNCLNSGLNRVYVLTQFLSVSLHRHLATTYKTGPFTRGFVEVLAAQQTNETTNWYTGTADALRQNLRYIDSENPSDVLVLSGDQVYRMDFQRLIRAHRETNADVTLAVAPVTRPRAPSLGILRLDEASRITQLVEKPRSDAVLDALRETPAWLDKRAIPRERPFLANMGIYLFKRTALVDLLASNPATDDLVQGILAPSLTTHRIQGYLFDGYWEDLGTIASYHEANLALASDNPPFDFHSPEGVIYTRMRNLPAARIGAARVTQSIIADGCRVEDGAILERSLLGVRSRIGRDAVLRDTIVLGSDEFETPKEIQENRRKGRPDIGIGAGSVLERAIVDKDCRIGRGVRIVNRKKAAQEDHELYVIRDGIVVIPNATTIPDGMEI